MGQLREETIYRIGEHFYQLYIWQRTRIYNIQRTFKKETTKQEETKQHNQYMG